MAAKFSDQGPVKQLLILLAFFGVSGGTIGTAVLALADNKIDQKYATDDDVASVQMRVEQEVHSIKTTVEANTKTVTLLVNSSDALTLTVIGLQMKDIADEIYALEMQKTSEGAGWNQREEANLREKQQALGDLTRQRSIVLNRVIAASNGTP